ncbi:endopeptidase La [Acholeplasma laidlawii]|uniref:Lon protease n=2 Tax=Acholeplasma laidlawii TaxID=2148 RepID=A9NFM4_ACHLI|nr:endopeptidase La [Acholeplasma laidlawii]ABX81154.1 serine protease Lon, ATP-dependent [Acholeplasma laidlawii PG-8A]NWH10277.1 endopeptidase La [Acholeplasma laidlawii]NWH11666.1 endopeptidase La [Acholeplasma laidlawii]NWH12926.1 endopeptidase La [Acholeplasma laidlawii]NWH14474.1 endopeptidase La [Acholeplasma laidlawii]
MELQTSLPAIVVRGIVPIPNNDFRIEVGRKVSLKAIEESEKSFSSYVLILVQKNPLIENPTVADIETHGVLAKIAMKIKLPNNNYKIKFNLMSRIKVNEYFLTDPYFVADYEELESKVGEIEEETTLLKLITDEAVVNANQLFNNAQVITSQIQSGLSSDKMADILAYNLRTQDTEKYKYLAELNVNSRLKLILEDINRLKMIADLEQRINEDVKKAIDENQKEYYLREKMRAIQNELGDKAKKEDEIDKLREDIKKAKMPLHIEEKALQELSRYQSTPSAMAESQIIKTYLDFLVALPWNESSTDLNDLQKVQDNLDKNHYGLENVKERIIEYLAVKMMTGRNPQTILCLAGPPGVGKTSLATSIAEALGRKFVKQSLGGVKDESEIRGHRRTYVGAMPGRILKGMKDAGTVNPVFLLDEIDKMASDYRGDPASAMLEVLDPEQNAKFSDHYLEENYDLSQVLFITTANYLENVPAPLRDRMEIVELSSYTEYEKIQIAQKHLVNKQLSAHGLDSDKFTIDEETLYFIVRHYTREAGVRELNRYIGSLVRKAIKEILMKKADKIHITKENVETYIGKPKFVHNLVDEKQQIGVVTGLAYTAFGGDTLPVEVTYYKGKGQLVLTGKLGDVMKESAITALSYVKSHALEFNLDPTIFENNDFHVHVPEGAIPKDGPSAGITMATAIMSAASKLYVRKDLGMTGEITLRGYVLPIGGLKEKAIAALRSGLTTILIPKQNVKDVDDIPKEVRDKLTIIPVENVSDVFAQALIR